MELASEGLDIVALERGHHRDTSPDYTCPKAVDELKYGIRGELFRRLLLETVTTRHKPGDQAVPFRQYNDHGCGCCPTGKVRRRLSAPPYGAYARERTRYPRKCGRFSTFTPICSGGSAIGSGDPAATLHDPPHFTALP